MKKMRGEGTNCFLSGQAIKLDEIRVTTSSDQEAELLSDYVYNVMPASQKRVLEANSPVYMAQAGHTSAIVDIEDDIYGLEDILPTTVKALTPQLTRTVIEEDVYGLEDISSAEIDASTPKAATTQTLPTKMKKSKPPLKQLPVEDKLPAGNSARAPINTKPSVKIVSSTKPAKFLKSKKPLGVDKKTDSYHISSKPQPQPLATAKTTVKATSATFTISKKPKLANKMRTASASEVIKTREAAEVQNLIDDSPRKVVDDVKLAPVSGKLMKKPRALQPRNEKGKQSSSDSIAELPTLIDLDNVSPKLPPRYDAPNYSETSKTVWNDASAAKEFRIGMEEEISGANSPVLPKASSKVFLTKENQRKEIQLDFRSPPQAQNIKVTDIKRGIETIPAINIASEKPTTHEVPSRDQLYMARKPQIVNFSSSGPRNQGSRVTELGSPVAKTPPKRSRPQFREIEARNVKKAKAFFFDDEKTLVEDQPPTIHFSSSSSESSSSSHTLDSNPHTPSSPSPSPSDEWLTSLLPRQHNLVTSLHHAADELVRTLISKESAITDILSAYQRIGSDLVQEAGKAQITALKSNQDKLLVKKAGTLKTCQMLKAEAAQVATEAQEAQSMREKNKLIVWLERQEMCIEILVGGRTLLERTSE